MAADDNKDPKPGEGEGGDGGKGDGGDAKAKEVVSYAKYKRETDEWQAQVDTLKAELDKRDQQIADIQAKADNADELKAALEKANADNEQYKADSEKREAQMRRDFAIDSELQKRGARSVKVARAAIDAEALEKAEIGEDGSIAGIDFDALVKESPYLFAESQRFDTGGTQKGGGGSGELANFRAQFGLDTKEGD